MTNSYAVSLQLMINCINIAACGTEIGLIKNFIEFLTRSHTNIAQKLRYYRYGILNFNNGLIDETHRMFLIYTSF